MDHRFEALGFRVQLTEDEGVWVATARRLDTGDTFGPPVPADQRRRGHRTAGALARVAAGAHHRAAGAADRRVDLPSPGGRSIRGRERR